MINGIENQVTLDYVYQMQENWSDTGENMLNSWLMNLQISLDLHSEIVFYRN